MIMIIFSIIAMLIIFLIIIYKLDRWDEFISILKWITSKKKVKVENKKQFKFCPFCSKTIEVCPYCKIVYCKECNKKMN